MRPYPDPTWFTPIYVVLSCIEVQLAIICASIPIFWPIIEQSLKAIFVSYDVEIFEQHIEVGEYSYGLEHTKACRGRKSSSASMEELTQGSGSDSRLQYSVGVDPLDSKAQRDIGPHTRIDSGPKYKWEI
jgi:hypothetical protein